MPVPEARANRQFDYAYIAPRQYQGLRRRDLLALEANPDWLSEDAWVISHDGEPSCSEPKDAKAPWD